MKLRMNGDPGASRSLRKGSGRRVLRPERRARLRAALILLTALAGGAGPGTLLAQGGAPPPGSGGEAGAAAPLLARLRARLDAREVFQSSFLQSSYWVAFDEADSAAGILTVAPPDRFRLDYERPAGHLIGSDGRRVWTFVPEDRQVLRARIEETTGWGQFFYEGLGQAVDSLACSGPDSDHGPVVRVPLRARPSWGVIELHVDLARATGMPVGYGYTDEEGNRFIFAFRDPRFVSAVDEGLFRFSVPEGYELFEVD
jgi:outer membrane lipoprotein-sorting protein